MTDIQRNDVGGAATNEVVTVQVLFDLLSKAEEEKNQYPVNFDFLWQWCGYTRKDSALRLLQNKFIEDKDYSTVKWNRSGGGAGKGYLEYWLTVEAAKKFAIKADTAKADEVHDHLIEAEKRCRVLVLQLKETRDLLSEVLRSYEQFVSIITYCIEQEEVVPNIIKQHAVEAKAKVLEYKARESKLLQPQDVFGISDSKFIINTMSFQAMASNEIEKHINIQKREFVRVNKRPYAPKKEKKQYYNSVGDVLLNFEGEPCTWEYILKYYDYAYDKEGNQLHPAKPNIPKRKPFTSEHDEF